MGSSIAHVTVACRAGTAHASAHRAWRYLFRSPPEHRSGPEANAGQRSGFTAKSKVRKANAEGAPVVRDVAGIRRSPTRPAGQLGRVERVPRIAPFMRVSFVRYQYTKFTLTSTGTIRCILLRVATPGSAESEAGRNTGARTSADSLVRSHSATGSADMVPIGVAKRSGKCVRRVDADARIPLPVA